MARLLPIPSPGHIARVRQRLYLVEDIVAPPNAGESTLVRLSCIDDDNQGQPLEVLWEQEVDPDILTGEAWEAIAQRGFDPPRLFSAYLHTLRWNCVTATDPSLFQAPFRAGIRIDAYQLEPLRKALAAAARQPLHRRRRRPGQDDRGRADRPRAAAAQEGAGDRRRLPARRCCSQWQEELETRFGLVFEILDRDYIAARPARARLRRQPVDHAHPLPRLAPPADRRGLRRAAARLARGPSAAARCSSSTRPTTPPRRAASATPSTRRFTRAIRDLAPRFEHRLFLSATPHNGHSNSFSALLEILDPQRFCRGVPVAPKHLDEVMVRRLKEDIRAIQGGFPTAHVVQIDIDGLPDDAPELHAVRAARPVPRAARGAPRSTTTKRKQAAAGLLIIGLQQRLLSSIEAFARTLRVHRRTVQRQWEAGAGRLPRQRCAPVASTCSPAASAATTSGPRSPRRSCRPRKTPRSRPPPRPRSGRCRPSAAGPVRPRAAAARRR